VRTLVFREEGSSFLDQASWRKGGAPLQKWAGQTIRIVFAASDTGGDSLVEAGIDDVRIERDSN
jgi:hypothetical protein